VSTKIKLILTFGVLVFGALSAWLEVLFADETVAKVIVGLVIFMIIALWIFPEAGAKDDAPPK